MLEELGFAVAAEGADGFDARRAVQAETSGYRTAGSGNADFDGMTAAETIIGRGWPAAS